MNHRTNARLQKTRHALEAVLRQQMFFEVNYMRERSEVNSGS